jgi:toxin YoeB
MPKGERIAVCHPEFLEDLKHWVETDRRTAKRLLELVQAILRDPFDGIGKPAITTEPEP